MADVIDSNGTDKDDFATEKERADFENIPVINPSNLRFGRLLFTGRFSTVFSAKMVTSCEGPREKRRSVAIKLVPLLQLSASKSNRTGQELRNHLAVQALGNHPNIVELFGYSKTGVGEEDPVKRSRGCLLLEQLAHLVSVADIQNRSIVHEQRVRTEASHPSGKKAGDNNFLFLPLSPLLAKIIFYQLLRALQHCHQMGICHGDVSPGNVMVDTNSCALKLCDFGSAQEISSSNANRHAKELDEFVGTDGYRAPEVLQGSRTYTEKIDLWSAGCLLAEMAGKTDRTQFFSASGRDKTSRPSADMDKQLETISSVLGISLLKTECLQRHADEPTWWPMLFHYSLPSSLIHLLSSLLICNPQKRLSAREACAHPFFKEVLGPGAALPNGKPLPEPFSVYATSSAMEPTDGLKEQGEETMTKPATGTHCRKWTWRKGTQGTRDPLTWLPPLKQKLMKTTSIERKLPIH